MEKPQPWDPYSKDCSQGYCSYYCPQWCFFLFPSPPPSPPSRPLLSPLLIAVITVVSTAFILVAYYLILTHYRRRRAPGQASPHPENLAAAWHSSGHDGLDETLINKIAACRYRAGGGLIADGSDCPVCLGQFEEGDRIRLLPKCSHAFHLNCIDTWLKAHSSCPLCRAGIFPLPANQQGNGTISTVVVEESESESGETESNSTSQNVSHEIVEINGEGGRGVMGRSFSMDSSLRMLADADAGSSKWSRALHSVMSPVRMKRSRSWRSTLPT